MSQSSKTARIVALLFWVLLVGLSVGGMAALWQAIGRSHQAILIQQSHTPEDAQ